MFRMNVVSEAAQPDQEQMQKYMEQWWSWINSIESKGQLAEGGRHLSRSGRVLLPGNKKQEGPYVHNNNSVAGYIQVLAPDLDAAVKLAAKCPILNGENTSVEVRETAVPGR